jgi:hypothetical protein
LSFVEIAIGHHIKDTMTVYKLYCILLRPYILSAHLLLSPCCAKQLHFPQLHFVSALGAFLKLLHEMAAKPVWHSHTQAHSRSKRELIPSVVTIDQWEMEVRELKSACIFFPTGALHITP